MGEGDSSSPLGDVRRALAAPAGGVHLLGACGVGMAGLAYLLKARGWRVSGCDRHPNRLADWLAACGIAVAAGHDASHVAADVTWLIRTAAAADDSPEVCHARARGIPVSTRGTVLPALLEGHTSVAVGGTHGKTTTTSFVTQMLKHAGRDPSWCIGGEVEALGGVAGVGRGGLLVVEADESDGTLALYAPDVAVVTNIEFDHMEHFENEQAFEACFQDFVRNARRAVVFCADDPRAVRVCADASRPVSYGFAAGADLRCTGREEGPPAQHIRVEHRGKPLGTLELPAPGRHNALNALAATAVGLELGLSFEDIRAALAAVSLPRRRFECVAERNGIRVISDYAHHPSEIAALVETSRTVPCRRRLAVFQPHRYTRTLALGRDFPRAFAGVDWLVLTPVYAASEPPLSGGTVWDLYSRFREPEGMPNAECRMPNAEGKPWCAVASSLEQAWAYLRRELREGDLLLVVGAGDVEKIAAWAGAEVSGQQSEPVKKFPDAEAGVPPVPKTGRPSHALEGGRPRPPSVFRCSPCFSEVGGRRSAGGGPALSSASVVRLDEPLAEKTTLKVGGRAEVWVEVGSVADLAALMGWAAGVGVPFRVLGGGSNVLVSDLGVPGVTARLAGPEFRQMREEAGGVAAGAGGSLAALLEWLQAGGREGLEFLEGIPGTVGGAAWMNAGAWGHEVGERLAWVRCFEADGRERVLDRSELRPAYRRLEPLAGRVVVAVGLDLPRAAPETIRARRAEFAERRRWMRGLRCAGSVFKNPAGDYAGRLIEATGLKGRAVGGASVSARHANVIVTAPGATASDVRSLLEIVRAEVAGRFGVGLEAEIELLE